ncbi:hypothetical protein NIES25_44030 [Nostoc linckia NIES-25]|nr:hypothetical protein NIES25_44030 [Nostoc linckia NIES-25]
MGAAKVFNGISFKKMSDSIYCSECGSFAVSINQDGFFECYDCGEEWSYGSSDPGEEPLDFGVCCACGNTDIAQNLIMLEYKTPISGTGWCCFTCGLPMDGAVTVVCDDCLRNKVEPKYAIFGFPTDKRRIEIEKLTEPFKHLDIPHE